MELVSSGLLVHQLQTASFRLREPCVGRLLVASASPSSVLDLAVPASVVLLRSASAWRPADPVPSSSSVAAEAVLADNLRIGRASEAAVDSRGTDPSDCRCSYS